MNRFQQQPWAPAWQRDIERWQPWKRELWEERAAIREYDGNQPKEVAEYEAYLEICTIKK